MTLPPVLYVNDGDSVSCRLQSYGDDIKAGTLV